MQHKEQNWLFGWKDPNNEREMTTEPNYQTGYDQPKKSFFQRLTELAQFCMIWAIVAIVWLLLYLVSTNDTKETKEIAKDVHYISNKIDDYNPADEQGVYHNPYDPTTESDKYLLFDYFVKMWSTEAEILQMKKDLDDMKKQHKSQEQLLIDNIDAKISEKNNAHQQSLKIRGQDSF